MKKILMISHHDIQAGSGGDVARVRKIAQLLVDSYGVRMFGLGYSLKKAYLSPVWLWRLAREIAKADWDFVYIYNQRHIVVYAWLLRFLLFGRYGIIYDAVLTWKLLPHSRFYKRFRGMVERLAGKCSDGVIAVSKLSGDFFGGKTLLVIPTLVDADILGMDGEMKVKVRERYGIARGDRLIGVVGPFGDGYNRPSLEYLRENIGRFGGRIKFMVIGKTDGLERIDHERVHYAGYVDDYVGYLSALDALLVIRKFPTDGAINRIVEAMAMGLPVFANPIARQTMDSAVSRRCLFVFDDDQLPSRVNKFMFDKRLMLKVGRNARHIAEECYAEVKYRQELLEALEKC